MKLWLLKPVNADDLGWDKLHGYVVCAKNAIAARRIANSNISIIELSESNEYWLRAQYTTCKLIGFATPSTPEGVVLRRLQR